ncbi:MAG: hypothetical protein JO173_12470, partial [Gammaproteobacteria bacterium]|nr:hypothetical protein [Gammaproteobacteria bacterium]
MARTRPAGVPEERPMYADEATVESPQLNLPADLLAEVSRRNKARGTDFR